MPAASHTLKVVQWLRGGGDMKVDSALSDVEVKDTDGNPVRLGSLWADRPAVVIWVRHFG